MKKLFLLSLSLLFITTGCFEESSEDLLQNFSDSITNCESYKLSATMEISSDTDVFNYTIESTYLEEDNYKVILINETNNQEQIILRNSDGVYVISPSLNKSFKFDSVWPDNSSQSYLLHSILDDIESEDEIEIIENEDGFEVTVGVNYPNNTDLLYEIIYFDLDMNLLGVEVYDEYDEVYIKVDFLEIEFDVKLSEEDFVLEDYIDLSESTEEDEVEEETNEACENCEEDSCEDDCSTTTSALDSVLYPLYIPSNTSLTSSEVVTTDYVDRVILTFAGDKNFVLIEEVATVYSEFETIPVTGNPVLLADTVAAVSSNSIYFTKNNVDYYIVSNDLTSDEIVSVANSIGSVQSVISTK